MVEILKILFVNNHWSSLEMIWQKGSLGDPIIDGQSLSDPNIDGQVCLRNIWAWVDLVRVFSDVVVAFLYFDIGQYRQSNLAIENPEFSQPVLAGHFQ